MHGKYAAHVPYIEIIIFVRDYGFFRFIAVSYIQSVVARHMQLTLSRLLYSFIPYIVSILESSCNAQHVPYSNLIESWL